jgi:hypothetical protein
VQPISTCYLEVLWHKRREKTAIRSKLQVRENRLLSAFWAVNDPSIHKVTERGGNPALPGVVGGSFFERILTALHHHCWGFQWWFAASTNLVFLTFLNLLPVSVRRSSGGPDSLRQFQTIIIKQTSLLWQQAS